MGNKNLSSLGKVANDLSVDRLKALSILCSKSPEEIERIALKALAEGRLFEDYEIVDWKSKWEVN